MATNNNSNKIEIPGYLRISKVIAYVLYAWVIIGVVSLVLRVFLLAFSANPSTPFVEFVYRTSADYLNPFRGIFETRPIGETGYFDVAATFAIIIYLFVMWGFSSLIKYVQFKIDQSEQEQRREIAAKERQAARTTKK